MTHPLDSRRRVAPIPKEAFEQERVAAFLDSINVLWCHVPNGAIFYSQGGRDATRFAKLAKLRRQGVKPGVVDVHIFTRPPARPDLRGAACELKRQRGPKGGTAHCAEFTQKEQDWLLRLDSEGWAVPIADDSEEVVALYGADEAIGWLEKLGYGRAT
jgi:hypothetical protein